jgi:hypothetical protein
MHIKNLFFKIILVKKGLVVLDFDDMPVEQKKKNKKNKNKVFTSVTIQSTIKICAVALLNIPQA